MGIVHAAATYIRRDGGHVRTRRRRTPTRGARVQRPLRQNEREATTTWRTSANDPAGRIVKREKPSGIGEEQVVTKMKKDLNVK